MPIYRMRKTAASEAVCVERVRPMSQQALERRRAEAARELERAEAAKHRQDRTIWQRVRTWLLGA